MIKLVVNKNIKGKGYSEDNQFDDILRLSDVLRNFSFHHKWKDGRILGINIVYTRRFTSYETT